MSGLRLSLLGPPQIECGNQPVTIKLRKAVALLTYLALTGREHRRDTLATMFWPELDQSRARAGLRYALSALRTALGQDWLDADRETIALTAGAEVWSDVGAFQAKLAECETHGHENDQVCPACLPALAEAVELYRDDFLAGFTLRDSPGFDEWQFFQAEEARAGLTSALERLVAGHSAREELEVAITYARRWVALDPLHEPAHRALMRLYAWSGQRTAAVRQYDECRRLLRDELDVAPDAQTSELYTALKNEQDPPKPAEWTTAPPQPGLLKDRYRLDIELGRGSGSVVYRAHDLVLERDVAVKVLSPAVLGKKGRARLLDEAQAAAKLNHPHIASIYDAGESEGSFFIVCELVEGETLHTYRPHNLAELLAISRQVCAALEHAHSHGIVHRDLKPENILITAEGTVKLSDFGLARPVASRITSDGAITGTVFYLAPELALGQEIDGRADLYALGVILYELTTGRLPFTADEPVAVISQHLHAPVVPPRAREADIPAALDDLIVRLLSKDPQDRPASAAQAEQILSRPDLLEQGSTPPDEIFVLRRIRRGRLVGREEELEQARALWNRTLAGQGQALLISGESGIGKTRLVRELATQVQVLGGRALTGACYAEGGVPYAPFVQIVRQALQGEAAGELALPEFVLVDLLTLAPALRLRYPDLEPAPALDDPLAEQHRLFENVGIFVAAVSRHVPLLLVIEDIHWAQGGSLALLRHLIRHSREERVLIVATYRPVEQATAETFHETLLDLRRERLVTVLGLSRLDREQTRQMLAALFAEEITPELRDGIYHETDGNPFFIEEVCKALVESGKVYFQDGRWHRPSVAELGIPRNVRVAIQSRIQALSPSAQATLQLAAILGRQFDFETLITADAGRQGEEALIEAVESALQAQLLEEVSNEGGGTFSFVHTLIPNTLIEGAGALERRRLHRQAAVALEARRPDDWEALAYQYDQAGQADKAADYWLQAGDRAR
ncbi:MAG: protein kinase, partial [Anaerolineae bacterium]